MNIFRFLLLFIFSFHFASGQALEVGLGVGVATYRGDLNPTFNPLLARPGAQVMVRYSLSRAFSVKAGMLFTKIAGKDAASTNPLNKERNWAFTGHLQEWEASLEYNFLNFRSSGTRLKSTWTPLLFLGLGQYRLSNRNLTSINATSNVPSGSPNLALNYGLGFKKEINLNWNFSASMGTRLPFNKDRSDLLDSFGFLEDGTALLNYATVASTSAKILTPNTHTRDTFFYTSITLSYVFQGIKCPSPRR